MPEHAVANIFEIGCASGEISVLPSRDSRRFRRPLRRPTLRTQTRRLRWTSNAGRDSSSSDNIAAWKPSMSLASQIAPLGQSFNLCQRLLKRVFQRRSLLRRSAGLAPRALDRAEHGHDAIRHAGRRTSAEKAKLSHGSDLRADPSPRRNRRAPNPRAPPPPPGHSCRTRARTGPRRAAPLRA